MRYYIRWTRFGHFDLSEGYLVSYPASAQTTAAYFIIFLSRSCSFSHHRLYSLVCSPNFVRYNRAGDTSMRSMVGDTHHNSPPLPLTDRLCVHIKVGWKAIWRPLNPPTNNDNHYFIYFNDSYIYFIMRKHSTIKFALFIYC